MRTVKKMQSDKLVKATECKSIFMWNFVTYMI